MSSSAVGMDQYSNMELGNLNASCPVSFYHVPSAPFGAIGNFKLQPVAMTKVRPLAVPRRLPFHHANLVTLSIQNR